MIRVGCAKHTASARPRKHGTTTRQPSTSLSMITHQDWNDLQRWLCTTAASQVLGPGPDAEDQCYAKMLNEPEVVTNWWTGAFDLSEEDECAITKAAIAVVKQKPLPELSLSQRGRLALRLRLASRIARAMSSRHQSPAKGWFSDHLSRMSVDDALEWLVTDGCNFWLEVLDETLLWANTVDHPEPFIRLTKAEAEQYNLRHGPAQ